MLYFIPNLHSNLIATKRKWTDHCHYFKTNISLYITKLQDNNEGCSKRIAYFYLETSNFKLAQKCSFHGIKELPLARNAKVQPM